MKYLDLDKCRDLIATHFPHPAESQSFEARCGYYDTVRFFGTGAIDPEKVAIRYDPGQFTLTDPLIADFATRMAARMRDEGRLYDGPMVTRPTDYDLISNDLFMTVQQASYPDMAGSCFALDRTDDNFGPDHKTLREYYLNKYRSRRIADNPLACCLGVCGLLVITQGDDKLFLTVKRSAHLASLAGTWGPSAAGSVDFKSDYRNLHQLIQSALMQEITEELCLPQDHCTITPLALAREILRGELPQIFCLIETDLPRSMIEAQLGQIDPSRTEFDSHSFLRIDQGAGGTEATRLNHEAQMNLSLAIEYLNLSQ